MKNITTRIRNITAAVALVVCSFAPAFSVAAIENEDNYVWINMRGATNLTVDGTSVIATYNDGVVTASGVADAIAGYDANHDFGENNFGPLYTLYTTSENITFNVLPNANKGVQIHVAENGNVEDGQLSGDGTYAMHYLKTYGYNDLHTIYDLEFNFVEEGTNPPQPGNDMEAMLYFSCADNTTGCFDGAGFSINDSYITGGDPENPTGAITYHYDGEEDDSNVTFRAETLWHMMFSGKIIINNQEIDVPINYGDKTSWFNYYKNQVVGFTFDIPKAADNVYVIKYNTAINPKKYIGNFLWSSDPADIKHEDYIGNSTLALVAVEYVYNGILHSCNADTGECVEGEVDETTGEFTPAAGCFIADDEDCAKNVIPFVEYDPYEESGYEKGSLVLPAGARVTMRIIPDYGYQVLNVNMSELVTSEDGIGEFTFTVPAGAAYFVADVIKTEDEVNTDESEMVESGSIDLGDGQTTLDHGTARLTIEDLALSDDEKKAFAEQVGDDGYEMKTYLDISLFNITYRGNTDSAWEEQVDDLNEEATITLQLSEDVDGNDIVIVHKKHDGTFEVIPTVYDPVAHTITFKTSSFSDYAIASRTVASPDTGVFTANSSASIAMSGLVTAQAFLTVFALSAFKKSYRK